MRKIEKRGFAMKSTYVSLLAVVMLATTSLAFGAAPIKINVTFVGNNRTPTNTIITVDDQITIPKFVKVIQKQAVQFRPNEHVAAITLYDPKGRNTANIYFAHNIYPHIASLGTLDALIKKHGFNPQTLELDVRVA